jgi:hypothetical protein
MKAHLRFIGNNKMKEAFVLLKMNSRISIFRRSPQRSAWFRLQFQIAVAHIDAVIRVYDEAGNVVETHEHAGEGKNSKRLRSYSYELARACNPKTKPTLHPKIGSSLPPEIRRRC